jgi:hypothetical protein
MQTQDERIDALVRELAYHSAPLHVKRTARTHLRPLWCDQRYP